MHQIIYYFYKSIAVSFPLNMRPRYLSLLSIYPYVTFMMRISVEGWPSQVNTQNKFGPPMCMAHLGCSVSILLHYSADYDTIQLLL